MDKQTLTIILCQTRESEWTFDSLNEKVLTPLNSDLAFCGSSKSSGKDKILANSKYVWNFDEPKNWEESCDAISTGSGNWRALTSISPNFLGGTGYGQSRGSGIIIMYWREILKRNLTSEIASSYEWFVITRSDFNWVVPHPNIEFLNKDKIYLLNGEKYGGISDRHIIFHKCNLDKVLDFASPIFVNPDFLYRELSALGLPDINPEFYLHFVAKKFGISDQFVFIPYLGFTVRHEGTDTRWAKGHKNEKFGYFVKYSQELRKSNRARLHVKSQKDWKKLLHGSSYPRAYIFTLVDRIYEHQSNNLIVSYLFKMIRIPIRLFDAFLRIRFEYKF